MMKPLPVVYSQKLGAEMMKNALALYPYLDAVFCTNGDLSLEALVWCLPRYNIGYATTKLLLKK